MFFGDVVFYVVYVIFNVLLDGFVSYGNGGL